MSQTKYNETVPGLKGSLEFVFRDKKTGEILDKDTDHNIVTNIGMSQILRAITTPAPTGGSLMYVLQNFRIGSDIGTGTLLAPEPAAAGYTALDQNPVYTVPHADLTITYPNYYTTEVVLVLDGDTIMANYPNEVDLRFSSAALYSGQDEVFAYRRFQTRTISREIVIDVKWTLYFNGQS